jgi:Fe2+ or Zn2+ uptake regulation protein
LEAVDVGRALKSQTRVNIMKILSGRKLRAIDVFNEYRRKFPEKPRHRESIYTELELLLELGMLNKAYEIKRKGVVYSLKAQVIKVDLGSASVLAEK